MYHLALMWSPVICCSICCGFQGFQVGPNTPSMQSTVVAGILRVIVLWSSVWSWSCKKCIGHIVHHCIVKWLAKIFLYVSLSVSVRASVAVVAECLLLKFRWFYDTIRDAILSQLNLQHGTKKWEKEN